MNGRVVTWALSLIYSVLITLAIFTVLCLGIWLWQEWSLYVVEFYKGRWI